MVIFHYKPILFLVFVNNHLGVHSKIDSHRKNTFQSIFYPQRYQCDRVQMDITETICLDTVYLCPPRIFLFKSWANCMYKSKKKTKKKKLEWKLVWSLCEIKQVQITCVGKNGSNYQIFVFLFDFCGTRFTTYIF